MLRLPSGMHARNGSTLRPSLGCAQRQACPQSQHRRDAACRAARPVLGGKVYLDPVMEEVSAFAPATVANLGPGFDWMGCAVEVGRVFLLRRCSWPALGAGWNRLLATGWRPPPATAAACRAGWYPSQ